MPGKLDDFYWNHFQNEIAGSTPSLSASFVSGKGVAIGVEMELVERFSIAARAIGEGPRGFSFDASLMMSCAGRFNSRATSSIGGGRVDKPGDGPSWIDRERRFHNHSA